MQNSGHALSQDLQSTYRDALRSDRRGKMPLLREQALSLDATYDYSIRKWRGNRSYRWL